MRNIAQSTDSPTSANNIINILQFRMDFSPCGTLCLEACVQWLWRDSGRVAVLSSKVTMGWLLAHVTRPTLKSTQPIRRCGDDVTIDDQILNRFQVERPCVPWATRTITKGDNWSDPMVRSLEISLPRHGVFNALCRCSLPWTLIY